MSTFKQPIFFMLVGFSGMFVDLGIVTLAKELFHLPTLITGLLGFSVSVSNNFIWNHRFTFKGHGLSKRKIYIKYVSISLIGLSLRMMVMALLLRFSLLDHYRFGYLVINFVGIVSATLFNFLGSKYLVFR